jgi:hypothetical protein
MATQNTFDRGTDAHPGEAALKQAARGPEKYTAGKLNKGWPEVAPRVGPDGKPLATSGYGRNQSAIPSSVGVEQSSGYDGRGLSDQPFIDPDPAKLALINGNSNATHDALDKVRTRNVGPNVGDARGMASARSRQSGGVDKFRSAALPSKTGIVTEQPVRQPPSGNTLKL